MNKRFLKAYAKSYIFRTVTVAFIMIVMCVLDYTGWTIVAHYDCAILSNILTISFVVHLVSGLIWIYKENYYGTD